MRDALRTEGAANPTDATTYRQAASELVPAVNTAIVWLSAIPVGYISFAARDRRRPR